MAGDAGLMPAVPRLKALLDDSDPDVRIRAAQGLLTLSRNGAG
jgi:hypothetical protein